MYIIINYFFPNFKFKFNVIQNQQLKHKVQIAESGQQSTGISVLTSKTLSQEEKTLFEANAKKIKVETQAGTSNQITKTTVTIQETGFTQSANATLQNSMKISQSDLAKYQTSQVQTTYYAYNPRTKTYVPISSVKVETSKDLIINNIGDGLQIVIEPA